MPVFDIDVLRGLVVIALLIGFLGIWAWAWSNKRKSRFHDASLLPLQDDEVQIPTVNRVESGIQE